MNNHSPLYTWILFRKSVHLELPSEQDGVGITSRYSFSLLKITYNFVKPIILLYNCDMYLHSLLLFSIGNSLNKPYSIYPSSVMSLYVLRCCPWWRQGVYSLVIYCPCTWIFASHWPSGPAGRPDLEVKSNKKRPKPKFSHIPHKVPCNMTFRGFLGPLSSFLSSN